MSNNTEEYIPISCGFHDYLEHFATLRTPTKIVYKNNAEIITLENCVIFDLSGGRKGEYAHIKNGDKEIKIRMDFIISIDDVDADKFNRGFC